LRLVWVIHDLHPFYFPEAWGAPALEMCRKVLPELARRARRIIVHNQFTHDSAVKHLGADPAKMTIIRLPHLMEQSAAEPTVSDDAVLAGLGVRKPYALWASSTTIKHKNHDRLIRAWVKVQSRRSERIQLVCSGNRQPRWHEVEPVLKSTEGKADIVFTNTVPKDSLRVLLRNATLAVCPTLFEGGGCGPAMEANYAGIPVVCSNIPQIREFYGERDDLRQDFDPLDEESIATAVLAALEDPEGSRRRADRVLEWLKTQRTWEDVARDYWKVIDAARSASSP
jgi:glycosyltransferase involved in cell wall biosynthesis